MALGLLEEKHLQDIATAIRTKNGKASAKYKPADMVSAIMELKLGGRAIVSTQVSEVYVQDGTTTINIAKTENEPEVGDFIIAQTKNGNDYDAAVFSITAVDKDTDADNYICSVTVSDTLDVVGVDSSDATALATDMIKGKTAYINNEKVTGTLEVLADKLFKMTTAQAITLSEDKSKLEIELNNDLGATDLVNSTTTVKSEIEASKIATAIDLKPADLITGKTVLGVVGNGGAAGGVSTTDANAIATNLEKGKTAYVNNAKVTGTLEVLSGENAPDTATTSVNTEKTAIEVKLAKTTKSIMDANASLKSSISLADLVTTLNDGGLNVNAGDIAQGKSILGVNGTFTSDANAVAANIEKDKTAYVNGVKVTGTLEEITNPMTASTLNYDDTTKEFKVTTETVANPKLVKGAVEVKTTAANLATEITLTADKIAKGTTILGIEGTFEATEDKEKQITDLTAEVARLQAIIDSYTDLNEKEF